MPPQRRLTKKERKTLAVLIVILAIYQRQRTLQRRARGHEERTSTYEPPSLHSAAWTMNNPGYHLFHDERDIIEFLW